MKKLLSFLALALCFVACQNESVEVVSNGDLADVVLTIDAPELGVTRADGDFMEDGTTPKNAKNSAYGAIDFFVDADWDTYDLRYILEVYDENEDGTGTPIYRERMVNCLDKYAPTTFALRLVPNRTYKFVVFADFVAEGNAELTEPADKLAIKDLYYNTADLRNVTAITTTVNPDTKVAKWGAMNEARDAYFVTENVEINNSLTKDLTLTRPFAKLRVIATDLDYIANYSKPGYVEVTYTEKIFKSFNAVNGNLNAAEMTGNELAYGFEVKKDAPYTAGYDAETTNQTLFTDYVLAKEGEQTTVNFTIAVYEDANKTRKIHEHNFNTQIPIQRNHLTTLIGDILTTQANIEIKIDDNFADEEYVIGVGDDNTTTINTWGAGQLNANGDYTFVVEGENDFKVTVNGASVVNNKLATGDYVLAEDAEKDENGNIVAGQNTFTVEELQANETTRALVAVEVIGGKMNVQAVDDNYKITLDLVLQFAEEEDVRHAIYTYEGTIAFGEVLDTPVVEASVEGNVVTLTWTAVADATKYTITGFTEEPIVVTEDTKYVFTGEYETEYTFSVVASNDTLNSQPFNGTVTTEAEPVVEPEEPTALATPVVNATVEGNVVTLTWATVENAGSYKVFIGDETDGISETVTPEEGATEVTFVKEGLDYDTEYTFTVYAIPANTEEYATSEGGTVTATTEAETTEPEEPLTIAEVLKANENDVVNTAGQVMAVYQKGFIMSDNTGTIVVYTSSAPSVKVGNNIAVNGTFNNYYGTLQISSPTITANDEATTAPVFPTPIDLTEQTAYDEYETFGTDNPTTFPYVKIKGKLSNGRYITVGTSTKQSMFNFSNSDYSAMNGKTITTVAYIMGYHSSNGYYQLVETSVEADPYISAENVSVAADATSATINVSANVAWTVTCDVDWVTLSTTDTAINATFAANELEESRTATFTLSGDGVDDVTVTLTQAAKPAEGVVTESVTLTMAKYFAEDETIVNTDGTAKSYTFGDYTFSFKKVNSNASNYNATDMGIRFYSGDVITIDAGNKTMVKIEFETYGGKTGPFTANVGQVDGTTWTGSATSVELTASAQVRFKSVTITYQN